MRRDPFAMLPFCGYHMGDYFSHWLKVGKELKHPPLIFGVNWFRKGADGKFMWPGYGDNMRVLEWIIGRVHGSAKGKDTLIGTVPNYSDINWQGLALNEEQFKLISKIDRDEWKQELELQDELIEKLKDRLPKQFFKIHADLKSGFETNQA